MKFCISVPIHPLKIGKAHHFSKGYVFSVKWIHIPIVTWKFFRQYITNQDSHICVNKGMVAGFQCGLFIIIPMSIYYWFSCTSYSHFFSVSFLVSVHIILTFWFMRNENQTVDFYKYLFSLLFCIDIYHRFLFSSFYIALIKIEDTAKKSPVWITNNQCTADIHNN